MTELGKLADCIGCRFGKNELFHNAIFFKYFAKFLDYSLLIELWTVKQLNLAKHLLS